MIVYGIQTEENTIRDVFLDRTKAKESKRPKERVLVFIVRTCMRCGGIGKDPEFEGECDECID